MRRAVIFDLDNTLEEWTPFEEDVERQCAEDLAKEYPLEPEVFKRIFDNIKVSYLRQRSIPQDYGRDVWFSEALAHFGIFDVDVDPIVNHYWDLLLGQVRLFPGARSVLEALYGRVKVGMLTDGDGDVRYWKEERIKRLGIGKYFDAIVTSIEIGANKPHPRCFIETARQLGVRPEECFMVGDKPSVDLLPAKELGMETIWNVQGADPEERSQSFPYIDHVVEEISGVTSIVLAQAPQIRH